MQSPERDMQSIRLVGGVLLGVGLIQLVLTLFIALFALFGGISSNLASFSRSLIGVTVSLVMASVISGCAIQLQQLHTFSQTKIQSIRLVWAGLVLILAMVALAALWVVPTLTTLAILLELSLFAIRPAIIRLSSP
ncbi:MAG TPA: hypothetical protein VMS08_02185 [Candidatus Saccharimonadia bacterium]|nr:hypothetical protein [Candidatus Saccharimonadia bacterium]